MTMTWNGIVFTGTVDEVVDLARRLAAGQEAYSPGTPHDMSPVLGDPPGWLTQGPTTSSPVARQLIRAAVAVANRTSYPSEVHGMRDYSEDEDVQ